MSKAFWRGLLTVAFFALVAFVLIPTYVPRPTFIPGFAPPPDMWPLTICVIGMGLGAIATLSALIEPDHLPAEDTLKEDGAPFTVKIQRLVALIAVFGLFLLLVPYIGFLLGTVLLTGATIFLTGERSHRIWVLAISIIGPILLVYVFNMALGTQFPKGLLTKTLGF